MKKHIFKRLAAHCKGRRAPHVVFRTSDTYLAALLRAKNCPLIRVEGGPGQLATFVLRVQRTSRSVIAAFTGGKEVDVNVRRFMTALVYLVMRNRMRP